jgi:lipoprotein-anchoring transpeptidase ErfK/SrfK
MMRLRFLLAPAALLLSSATPHVLRSEVAPAALPAMPRLTAEPVMDFGPDIVPVRVPAPQPVASPEPPPTSGVRVVVSLPQQKLYLFEDGELVATSPVSTGKRGHATPTGTFPILQKKVHHRSSKYDNAPMPYMQRLTNYGIAIHAGALPGYPASHGCIRLPRSFAKKLYGITDYGTRVTITRGKPKSPEEALRLA